MNTVSPACTPLDRHLYAGLLLLRPVTLGVEGYGIDLVPGAATIAHSLLASLLIGVLASLLPAWAVARRPLHRAVKEE